MIDNTGTVTTVSGSAIVKGSGTKWNSNNPLVSPGMLMLIKNGDVNYPYMIKAVNSDTELVLAEKATFSATDTIYTLNRTEPNNNSDAARALVAANTYILYFLQNMDTWMADNGVVELTLPSGKTVKLESIKALQELVKGKADTNSVEDVKESLKEEIKKVNQGLEKKADKSSVEEINKTVADKFDKIDVVQALGSATDKVISQKAGTDTFALKVSSETFRAGKISAYHQTGDSIFFIGSDTNTAYEIAYVRSSKRCFVRNNATGNAIYFPLKTGEFALISDIPKIKADSNGFLKKTSPIIKIYANGNFETNDESKGATIQRPETGKYLISGVLGYNADGAWGVNGGISIPKDINGLELIYAKDKILPNGDIEIQTFHRQHAHLPKDFQNWRIKEFVDEKPIYYSDGEDCDIPPSTWLDVRVEMPVDSIWNQQQAQKE